MSTCLDQHQIGVSRRRLVQGCAVTGVLSAARVREAAAEDTVSGSVTVGGTAWPLPPGPWRRIVFDKRNRLVLPADNVYAVTEIHVLAQASGDRIGMVKTIVHARPLGNSTVRIVGPRETPRGYCDQEGSLAVLSLRADDAARSCGKVTALPGLAVTRLSGEFGGGIRKAWEQRALPAVIFDLRSFLFGREGQAEAHLMINPEAWGMQPDHRPWVSSAWNPANGSMRHIAFLRRVQTYFETVHRSLDAVFIDRRSAVLPAF
ncbi:hypothetical protein [Elioraea thermophila]|uniref:hypothetical protein n=1 Tax=Elioraea thermophila TaxID=2185104 RepID=UPI0013002880|nr:hypothetical protein [Elioraea thermophila]